VAEFIAFDLEIAKEIPEGTDDWKKIRPLGISCAATLTSTGGLRLWHGREQRDGTFARQMTPEECNALFIHMLTFASYNEPHGYVLTFNGLGFDFDILAEECSPAGGDVCHQLARYQHIDMGFAMFCEKGYMIGLQAAAKGMGLPGKTEGMHGDLAPKLWAQGREEQNKVLEYVIQDARTTADVYRAILRKRALYWTSKSSKPRDWNPHLKVNGDVGKPRMLTVDECLQLPEPDTSWMDKPWPRTKFTGWLELQEAPKPAPSLPSTLPLFKDMVP
jgi:hypothetical protein